LGDDGTIHTKKISSSVDDYARAIVEGLRELFRKTGLAATDVAEILHGTTVASNAILEGRGALVKDETEELETGAEAEMVAAPAEA
jgi:N-methylhydantoinase A